MKKVLGQFYSIYIRMCGRILLALSGGKAKASHIHIVLMATIGLASLAIINQWQLFAALMIISTITLDMLQNEIRFKSDNLVIELRRHMLNRVAESAIFISVFYVFIDSDNVAGSLASVTALSGALVASYLQSRGQMILDEHEHLTREQKLNLSHSGLMSFHVRMLFVAMGLVLSIATSAVAAISIATWMTVIVRYIDITEALNGTDYKEEAN